MKEVHLSVDFKPENHQELYESYSQIEPNERLVRAIQAVSKVIYRPNVHLADGAQDELKERIEGGDSIIIASNHLNIADQFPISALISQLDFLKPLEGKTFALAKADYFKKPYLRRALDATGTLPVFRRKDMPNNPRLQARAARSLIDTSASRLCQGWHMLVFPEGTRNQGDQTKLGKVEGGIGRIAAQASKLTGVSVLPIALWYGEEGEQRYLKPDIFISRPIMGPFASKTDVVRSLQPALQHNVEEVIDLTGDAKKHPPQFLKP